MVIIIDQGNDASLLLSQIEDSAIALNVLSIVRALSRGRSKATRQSTSLRGVLAINSNTIGAEMLNRGCRTFTYTKGTSSNSLLIVGGIDLVVLLRQSTLNLCAPTIEKYLAYTSSLPINTPLELYLIPISFALVEATKVDVLIVVNIADYK